MSETPENGMDQSTQKLGFFRRQFSLRGLRRALIGLVVLVTLIALVVTEEDWRGKHDWETYRHEWESKGEKFDWQAFVPPTVPDDQNLLTSLVMKKIVSGKIQLDPYPKDTNSYNYTEGDWQKNSVTDLRPWQKAYRDLQKNHYGERFPVSSQPQAPAADVLLALSLYDPVVEELQETSQRPYSSIPMNYEEGFNAIQPLDAYLAALKRCSQVLQLRIIAELANNQSSQALSDMKLWFRLNDSIRNSPFLISQLVRMAITSLILQPVWEGLAQHEWSDDQLAELESELGKMDFLADYEFSMRGERAFAIASIENLRRTREMISFDQNSEVTNKFTFMPSAFFYQNELSFARMHQQWLLPIVDIDSRIVSPESMRQADQAIQAELKHYSPYKIEALMTGPAIDKAITKFAFAQSSVDLARVACALERYRLAHGEYPQTLAALTPQFIAEVPHDIINGQPLHYRLRPDGQFILYSVGWNETDDGGQIVLTRKGAVDRDKGDWVWQYPAK
jgi:hypothetical protein